MILFEKRDYFCEIKSLKIANHPKIPKLLKSLKLLKNPKFLSYLSYSPKNAGKHAKPLTIVK